MPGRADFEVTRGCIPCHQVQQESALTHKIATCPISSLHSLNACFPKAPAMMLLVLPHVPAPYMCMHPFCQSRAERSQDLPCAQENRLGFSPPCVTVCGVRLGEGLQVRKGLGKASAAQQGLDIAGSVPGAGMRWAVMSCGFYVVNIEHRELR